MSAGRDQDLRRLLDLVAEADVAGLAGTEQAVALILDRLPSVIPCDTVMYSGPFGNGSTSTNREFSALRSREWARWCAYLGHHPKLAYWAKNPTLGAVRFSDVVSQRALQALPVYNDFWRPFEIHYDLGVQLVLSPTRVVWFSCARRNCDFSSDDRAVFDALRPYATAIFRRAESSPFTSRIASRFGLSRREGEVLALAASGKTNKEIAGTLFLSPGTVRKHLERIYPKLGVKTRTEAAAAALAAGVADELLPVEGAAARFALTPREVQVLERVAVGGTNREIGATLGLASETVKKHLDHIYAKLGVHGRTDAAVRAIRSGLVPG
jgi:DNA-binding CsgD family transcriptional regulator